MAGLAGADSNDLRANGHALPLLRQVLRAFVASWKALTVRPTYPSSFLKLLLIGFGLAVLPVIFAFANASLYLERFTELSNNTVTQAVQATRDSRSLIEQLSLMERISRQYLVLEDRALLEHFMLAHRKFNESVRTLNLLPLDQKQHDAIRSLSAKVDALAEAMHHPPSLRRMLPEFSAMFTQANDILSASNNMIERETKFLQVATSQAKRDLVWQMLAMIPVVLMVTGAMTYLLAQPVRRMDEAIRRLGQGDYADTITIDGPGDLRILGERLDWLRSQLLDLESQKKRFLRHVSHELKTPLTAIREGSELLSEEVGGALTPQQMEIASILRENSLRLQKMIENLLNYTAAQFQKPQLDRTSIALKPLIHEALDSYALSLTSKQIRPLLSLSDVEIEGDRDKLLTVIDNLLSNAVKFSPRGGAIGINLSSANGLAVIDVSDAGPGIPESERANLFDPFFRGSGSYDSHVHGTGLGLSIAREYVEAHGGALSLAHSGKGARFRISLPLSIGIANDQN